MERNRNIRKAIIPVAGFGTRLYPASRALKKDFFPIPDKDGKVKPVILILLEELVNSGIEEICLVLGSEEERELYRAYFETPLPEEHLKKLKPDMLDYEQHILAIGCRLRFVYQTEKRGFGHAVYQAADFAAGEPVLLLLGDTLYRSDTDEPCALQMIRMFEKCGGLMVAVHPIPLQEVLHYGILAGSWVDEEETVMNVTEMTEKPTPAYAETKLGVKGMDGQQQFMSVFGQYVLTPEVFEQLRQDISSAKDETTEIELTAALEKVRKHSGMSGVRLKGRMYDMGNYSALRKCSSEYAL